MIFAIGLFSFLFSFVGVFLPLTCGVFLITSSESFQSKYSLGYLIFGTTISLFLAIWAGLHAWKVSNRKATKSANNAIKQMGESTNVE